MSDTSYSEGGTPEAEVVLLADMGHRAITRLAAIVADTTGPLKTRIAALDVLNDLRQAYGQKRPRGR